MSETSTATTKSSNKFSKISKKKLTILVLAAIVFLVCVIFVSHAGTYSDVYPNTYINGVSIGGMSKEELTDVYEKIAAEASLPQSINLTYENDSISIDASEIALEFDWDKTTADALGNRDGMGFFANASAYFKSIFSDTNLTPAVKYDSEKFDKIVDEYVAPYEIEPEDASYSVENGKLTIKKGKDGKKLNKEALKAEISKHLSETSPSIALVIAHVEGKTFEADSLYEELTQPPKDAYYDKDESGNVIVVADKPQITVDKDVLKEAVESGKDPVTISVKAVSAKKTKKELESALFSGTMGSWTSNFSASNVSRTANVTLAASRINNYVLMPGESFSYDKTVGPRTTQNGYKVAAVYVNNKVENGVGGGICQTSSTLYSAVLYANLEIVSRTSHSLPVSYMPAGQDATIAAGSIDFVFRNNTDYPIKIVASINGGSVTCSIVGTPVKGQKVVITNTTTAVYTPKIEIATDASVPQGYKKTAKGSGGCAVSSTRTVYQDGVVVKTEPLTRSVYNATPTVVTVNPADKDVPPESLAEVGSVSDSAAPEDVELNGNEETRAASGDSTDDSSESEEETDDSSDIIVI